MARVCVDSTFFGVDGMGQLTFKRTSVGLQQLLVFTTVGTIQFHKADYPGLTRVRARVIGGGGGAAGALANASQGIARAGGSGGGYSESVFDAASLAASEVLIVGGGGAGGTNNVAGANGDLSAFAGTCFANGGLGSQLVMSSGTVADATIGVAGAAVGSGQIALPGGPSEGGIRPDIASMLGGIGGTSGGAYGVGGLGASAGSGTNGIRFGGGGGGACSTGSTASGGNGAPGAVFLELFY